MKDHQAIAQSYPFQSWVVVFTASLFFFYEFIQMNMFNAISQDLMHDFHISATQLGNLSASYFYANVLFLFIAGMTLDRVSPRKLITCAMTVCVISTFAFAHAQSFWLAQGCRFLTGIASTVTLLSCVRLASRWFPAKRLALIMGLVVTMGMVGGMLAQTPMTLLSQHLGWRHAVIINSYVGIAFIVLIALLVRDKPKNFNALHHASYHHPMPIAQAILAAIKNKQNWIAGIYTNVLSLPIVLLGALWGSLYLINVQHQSILQASNISAMTFVGMIIGSPLTGHLSDLCGKRKMPMILGALTTLITLLIILYVPHLSTLTLFLLFFLLGLFSSTQIITYALLAECNPINITTTAEGLACTLIMSAGAIFQPLYGWIMDLYWQGQHDHGEHIYSATSHQHAMLLVVGACCVGLIMSFFIKETNCQRIAD
jgi:MFS family permease